MKFLTFCIEQIGIERKTIPIIVILSEATLLQQKKLIKNDYRCFDNNNITINHNNNCDDDQTENKYFVVS